VLALVLADGDLVGVVEEDVGGHQDRVGQQRGPDLLLATRFLLELDRGRATGHEQAGVWVEAGGQQQGGELQRALSHLRWVVSRVRACRSETR
jgi:hypothetical protein